MEAAERTAQEVKAAEAPAASGGAAIKKAEALISSEETGPPVTEKLQRLLFSAMELSKVMGGPHPAITSNTKF